MVRVTTYAQPFLRPSHYMTEIIDFGYPQNSEADTLKTYITTESVMASSIAAVSGPINVTSICAHV